jgi:O-antigen/teichoic acid export membrane protein
MTAVSVPRRWLPAQSVVVSRWRWAMGQGGAIFLSYAVTALVGMGSLRLYTELAPKSVFGESNLLLTILTLGIQLFVAPFTNTQLRYHTKAQEQGTADAFTREALAWSLRGAAVLGLIAFVACLIAARLGGPVLGGAVGAIALGWVLATATRNVLMGRLQAERRRIAYAGLMVVEAVLSGGLTAAALIVSAGTAFFMAGQLMAAIVLVVLLARVTSWPFSGRPGATAAAVGFRTEAARYGLPFAPLAIAGWLSNLADRYVLGMMLGAAAAGQYVAPLSIASRALILTNSALNDLFRPVLFDAENRGQRARADRVFWSWVAVNLAVGCAAVLTIALFGQWAVTLLLSESYREGAVDIMVWIAAGYGVYGLTQVLENRLLSLGRSGQLLAPMTAGAVANVVLSMLLVPRYGIIGAARASCLSFVTQSVVTLVFLICALRRAARNGPKSGESDPCP